jgi:uncharacterized membrane protein
MVIIGIALPIFAFVVLLVLIGEVHRYKSGRHIISARRLGLRLVAGVLLLALIALVFVGLFVLHLREAAPRPQLFVTFWSTCLLIAVLLILVMLVDLREVGERYTQRQHEIWRDFAGFLARQVAKPPSGSPPPKPDEPKR